LTLELVALVKNVQELWLECCSPTYGGLNALSFKRTESTLGWTQEVNPGAVQVASGRWNVRDASDCRLMCNGIKTELYIALSLIASLLLKTGPGQVTEGRAFGVW